MGWGKSSDKQGIVQLGVSFLDTEESTTLSGQFRDAKLEGGL